MLLRRLYKSLCRLEDGILVALLLAMIGFAVLQIFLRNFFETGIVWTGPFLRMSVLWITLIGAMIASRRDQHIRIDLATRYLPEILKRYVSQVTLLFTAVVCAAVSIFSIQFVQWEYEDGTLAFGAVPTWLCASIIPFAFMIIALRYATLFLIQLKKGQEAVAS